MTRAILGWLTLGLILLPLAYALCLSFTPGELLELPQGAWSLRWYREFFDNAQWMSALWNSLVVALFSALVAVGAGTSLALALARRRLRGAAWLSTVVLLPLFVPGVVLGMALLPWVHRIGLWGTMLSLVAAHALWSLPIVFLVARAALAETDPNLEVAARTLGASGSFVFRRVTLPLIAPSIVAGGASAFVLSLNEFAMALFLATPAIETLPKVIWPSLRYTLSPLVAAASSVSLGATILGWSLIVCAVLLQRRMRATTRVSGAPGTTEVFNRDHR